MSKDPIQHGSVTSSYFWDDGSGINGDTGAPASGEPMQEGMAASPSWPLGTKGYVEYNGKKEDFFIGDRGPGDPAEGCNILLDLDGKTFADLVGGSFDETSYTVSGGEGHIDVDYYITEWGDGAGTEGAPRPMSGSEVCDDEAVKPIPESKKSGGDEQQKESEQASSKQASEDEGQQAEESAQAESEEQSADDSGSQQADSGSEDQGAAASGGDGDDGGSGNGLTAETAANDVSGFSLAGNDLPLAAGVLTLAIVPALLVALFFARRGRAAEYAGGHRAQPLLSAAGMRETVQNVRERIPGSWSEAKSTAGSYWTRVSDSVRERRSGGRTGE